MKEKYYKSQLNYSDIGVKDRRIKVMPKDIAKMKKLKSEGLSYSKIAQLLKLTYSNVYLYLNQDYYEECKKHIREYRKEYYKKNKESILLKSKKYRDRKKKILSTIDASKYLVKKEPKLTIKRKIINFTKIGEVYTYKQIKDMLNKDYGIFSRRIKELERQGFIEVVGKNKERVIKRIK